MSVDSLEASEQDSEPREIYDIVHGTTSHRITFADHDLVEAGVLYAATPGGRGSIAPAANGNGKEMQLTLPINHALVRRYLRGANPPGRITVTMRRKFYPSGDIETRWVGDIESISVDDENTEATFVIPSTMSRNLLRVISNVTVSRSCQHALFDSMCSRNGGVERAGFNPDGHAYKLTTTVLHVNGRVVRVDLTNVPAAYSERATWCENGELVHTASGEVLTIREQNDLTPGVSTVTDLVLQMPLVDIQVGHSVDIYAGCNLSYAQCQSRFGNRQRFGGLNSLPEKNPFVIGISSEET